MTFLNRFYCFFCYVYQNENLILCPPFSETILRIFQVLFSLFFKTNFQFSRIYWFSRFLFHNSLLTFLEQSRHYLVPFRCTIVHCVFQFDSCCISLFDFFVFIAFSCFIFLVIIFLLFLFLLPSGRSGIIFSVLPTFGPPL